MRFVAPLRLILLKKYEIETATKIYENISTANSVVSKFTSIYANGFHCSRYFPVVD